LFHHSHSFLLAFEREIGFEAAGSLRTSYKLFDLEED